MPIKTALTEMLGIEYPIIQGGNIRNTPIRPLF